MRIWILTFFCCVSLFGGDRSHLSSKAVRHALRAKDKLEGTSEEASKSVVELEQLLKEPSFRRLDVREQVQILVILSRAYESLKRFEDQERLLSVYTNRREFYRYFIPLRVDLVRSYVQQGRINDADEVIKKLIKSSCAHLSLEEQREIASVIAYRDEYLFKKLNKADRLCAMGRFVEALSKYQMICQVCDRKMFPYQASIVEKRRFRQRLLLRVAEVHFSLGQYALVKTDLKEWDERLFAGSSEKALSVRRKFLLEYSSGSAKSWDAIDWGGLERASVQYLLWMAQGAIDRRDVQVLARVRKMLVSRSLIDEPMNRLLLGFEHALNNDLVRAVDDLFEGLEKSSFSESPWRESAYHLLSECGWQRVLLFALSHQQERAEQLAVKLLSVIAPGRYQACIVRKAFLALFLYKGVGLQKYQSLFVKFLEQVDREGSSDVVALLHSAGSDRAVEVSEGMKISTADRLFCAWLRRGEESIESYFFGEASSGDEKTALWMYTRALFFYRQAVCDDVSCQRACSLLYQALGTPGLEDVRAQLLHALVDLTLKSGHKQQAYELITEIMECYADYAPLPSLVLSCITAFEAVPAFEEPRRELCEYIFQRPIDLHAFVLVARLFDSQKQGFLYRAEPLVLYESALEFREKGRRHLLEARNSSEPGIVKDRLLSALEEYSGARQELLRACHLSSVDRRCQGYLWSCLIALHKELSDVLCKTLMSDSAFNELPEFLEMEVERFKTDLDQFVGSISDWSELVQPALYERSSTIIEGARLQVRIFKGERAGIIDEVRRVVSTSNCPFSTMRLVLFLAGRLREEKSYEEALSLLGSINELELVDREADLALEIAIEKSLCLWSCSRRDKAMSLLAWVINGPYASSLRIKAMIVRADFYCAMRRNDLAVRQLESVVSKGGEWAVVADGKLKELYGI